MKLEKVIVKNFKSYVGEYLLGPFDNFTCIIGPNGSGKSNILDAITFALNVNIQHLRVNHATEFVSVGQEECFVNLYINVDGGLKVFSKTFNAKKHNYVYKVNECQKSSKQYTLELEKLNIFSKIRNFIIYQGMLINSKMDLFQAIENISGSINFKEEYDKLKENYVACNKELQQKQERKKDILNDLNEANDAKEKEVQFVKNMNALEELKGKMFVYEIASKLKNSKRIEDLSAMYRKESEKIINNPEYDSLNQEILCLKQKSTQQFQAIFEMETEIKCIRSDDLKARKNNEKELGEEISNIKKNLERLRPQIDYQKYNPTISFEECKNTFLNELEQAKIVYNEQTENYQKEESKLMLDNFEAVAKKEECLMEIKKYKEKKERLIKENKRIEIENKNKKEQILKIERQIVDLTQKASPDALEQLKSLDKEIVGLENNLNDITKEILLFKAKNVVNKNEIFVSNVIENLKAVNPGVLGSVSSLIKPSQKKFEIPIAVLMQKHANSVIVENEDVALECILYLKETKSCKLTFLTLNKFKVNTDVVVGDDMFLNPLNCIVCDNKYLGVAQFLFHAKVIAENSNFENKNIGNFKAIATLNGILYQQNGLITGGNITTNKFEENKISELTMERTKIINKIKNLKTKKDGFTGINFILEKIKELEKTKNEIVFEKLHEIEECLKDVDVLNLEATLMKFSENLKEFEYERQFVRENMRKKEKELILPILRKTGFNSVCEFTTSLKEDEKRFDLEEKLHVLEQKYAEILKINAEKSNEKENFNKALELEKKLHLMQQEFEINKQTLKAKEFDFKEFLHKLEIAKNKLFNISLSKSKNEEEINDILNFCRLETDFSSIDEITSTNLYKEIENKNEVMLLRDLNDLKKEKNRLESCLSNNATLHIKDNSLEAKYLKFNREFEFAKESAQRAKEHFNEIAVERKKLFDVYFEKLQRKINEIYKKLAYVNTECRDDENECAKVVKEGDIFSPGNKVKFYVVPPGKGYCEFTELSGGERSLAALSFLFALQKTPPFYVLDEVDAALDRKNVENLVNYIKNEATTKQFIVISLKDYFFKEADGLLGVYKDQAQNRSRILTYKLVN
ncbi:SMC1 [Ecytonucleospora hepatopenaei]|uniref:SMC1 n=1 Tax=Ecytonucleospora hepatopenaei TaxID=646526 RepID=A0A1W0E438_9MICR|nr:SMC1 [Ecytonucleospora hepatopenaei]